MNHNITGGQHARNVLAITEKSDLLAQACLSHALLPGRQFRAGPHHHQVHIPPAALAKSFPGRKKNIKTFIAIVTQRSHENSQKPIRSEAQFPLDLNPLAVCHWLVRVCIDTEIDDVDALGRDAQVFDEVLPRPLGIRQHDPGHA